MLRSLIKMKINEIISEARGVNPYKGFTQDQINLEKNTLDKAELELLRQYKEELLQKLDVRGIDPDRVGHGVSVSPDETLPINTQIEILRKQVNDIRTRLKQDSKSFVQPAQQYQKEKQKIKKMSGPVINVPVDQFNK